MKNAQYYIYIDDLIEFGQHSVSLTGIQRVMIETIKGMRTRLGSDNVRLIANRYTRKFVAYSSELFTPDWVYDQEQFCRFFGVPAKEGSVVRIPIDDLLTLKYRGPKLYYSKARLHFRNFCTRGATFRKIGASAKTPRKGADGGALKARRFELKFTPADTVYVPGEFWSRPIEKLIETFGGEDQAPRLVLYLHDLIPLVTPQYTGRQFQESYEEKLNMLLKYTTKIIVNSKFTGQDVEDYVGRVKIAKKLSDVAVVPLAHEFGGDENLLDPYERGVVSMVAHHPFVLVVGTANPRKNAWSAAYVWMEIRKQLGLKTPRIVFVDRHVLADERFRGLMEATKNIFGLAEVMQAPTDAQLAYLYRHCLFTIYPSLYEGWGLPIGESLWMGKLAVVANRTSLPEVGEGFVDYFDPADLQSFYDACVKLILDPDYRASRESNLRNKRMRRWTDVISETIDAFEAR